MFCAKCGNKLADDDKFCGMCGEPVPVMGTAPVEGQTEHQIPDMNTSNMNVPNMSMPNMNMPNMSMPNMNMYTGQAPKPKSKIKIFVISGVAVVGVALLTFFNFDRINNFVHKQFSSPAEYYQFVESRSVKEMAASGSSMYGSYLNAMNVYDRSVSSEFALELGDEGQDLIALAGLAGVNLSWLESVGISVDYSAKNNTFSLAAGTSLNNDNIISGSAIIDLEDGSAYLQIPELSNTYLCVEFAEILDEYDRRELDEMVELLEFQQKLMEALPDEAQMENLINKYMSAALSQVDNVSMRTGTIKAEGIQQSCTELTIKIDGETMRDIAVQIIKTAQRDKDLKQIIIDYIDANDYPWIDGDEAYEEFLEELDDALSELKEASFDDDDFAIEMKVYVDGKGNIKGRIFEITAAAASWGTAYPYSHDDYYDYYDYTYTTTITMVMPEKGRNFGYELSMEYDNEKVELSGAGNRKGDEITGDFQIKYNGTALVDITATGLNTEDLKKGTPNGTLTVGAASTLKRFLGEYGYWYGGAQMLSAIGDVKVTMDFDVTDASRKCKISVTRDKEYVGAVSVSVKTGAGSKATRPSGKNVVMIEDEYDVLDWLEDIDWDRFIDKLDDTDLPHQWVNMIDDAVEMLEYGYWYW